MEAVHSVDAGFDSCKKVSTSKLSSVNATLEKVNQPCPIYDVNNVAKEEKFISTIILPIKVTKLFLWV